MVVSKRSRESARFLAVRSLRYPYRASVDAGVVRPENVEAEWPCVSAVVQAGTRTYAFTTKAHRDAFAAKYNGRVY